MFARRAHVVRRHKAVKDSTKAFLSVLARHFLGSSCLPPELLDSFCKSKAANTWDSYVAAAQPWFAHAVSHGFPAMPADPVRLACWLASVGCQDRGYKPTKSRCCAIDALHTVVGLQPPGSDPRIQALRALLRRTKTFRRGRARPVLRAEIPLVGPDPAASSPPRGSPATLRGRRAGPSPQTKRRRRDATVAHMALLHDATLRHDDTREGQLGDISLKTHSTLRRSMSGSSDPKPTS